MKGIILLNTFLIISTLLLAVPPKAPKGKVWVLNTEMSDEFDVNGPDLDVWNIYSRDRSWDRTAAFDPSAIESQADPENDGNYFLTMNPIWYTPEQVFTKKQRTYNFAGAAMDTKNLQTYGYYEVRLRPSDFPFGSGVFMNSRGNSTTICEDKYSTELDIIENISYTGPESAQRNFNYVQHVNSHTKNYHYTDENGDCVNGGRIVEGCDPYTLDDPHGWFTVGMWWENSTRAHFYNNDREFGSVTPGREFKIPMAMILSMETYVWGDDDENNAGNPKPEQWMWDDTFRSKDQRAVKYDWVRVWKLVDIDPNELNENRDNLKCPSDVIKTYPGENIDLTLIYSAQTDRRITATLLDPDGKSVALKEYNVECGVHSINVSFLIDDAVEISENYSVKFEIVDGANVLVMGTTPVNVA